jgi:hypothetical protein
VSDAFAGVEMDKRASFSGLIECYHEISERPGGFVVFAYQGALTSMAM